MSSWNNLCSNLTFLKLMPSSWLLCCSGEGLGNLPLKRQVEARILVWGNRMRDLQSTAGLLTSEHRWTFALFGPTEMAMVQTSSSRGQCRRSFGDVPRAPRASVCFYSILETFVHFIESIGALKSWLWFISVVTEAWNSGISLNSSKKVPNLVNPADTCIPILKCAVLFGIEILVFRRHSVLCASELLIIYWFIVCLWCVFLATAETHSGPTNLFLS